MQLRALIYFNELVRSKSMRKAAERLGVAPTAISRQIENLEYHFGAPLVERDARGVQLTAAGELLAARTARTLRELDHVRTLIGDLQGLQRGRVSVYANGAASSGLLAPALSDFSLLYPKIRFDLTISSAGKAMEALAAGEADLAITLFTPSHPSATVRHRFDLVHTAVMAPDHVLAERAEVSLAELMDHPLALPDESFGVRKALNEAVRAAGLPPLDPVFTTSSLEMQKEFARRGAAILILPAITVHREREAGELVAVPLAGSRPIKTGIDLSHARDRPLSFAAAKLESFLERYMTDLVAGQRE